MEEQISDDMNVVEYDATDDWIREGKDIIITMLDGTKFVVKHPIFFNALQGFIQTPGTLYVPYRRLGETHYYHD